MKLIKKKKDERDVREVLEIHIILEWSVADTPALTGRDHCIHVLRGSFQINDLFVDVCGFFFPIVGDHLSFRRCHFKVLAFRFVFFPDLSSTLKIHFVLGVKIELGGDDWLTFLKLKKKEGERQTCRKRLRRHDNGVHAFAIVTSCRNQPLACKSGFSLPATAVRAGSPFSCFYL